MYIIWTFDIIENKHNLYRGEDYMKMFCSYLREHAANVINFERKKEVLSLKKRAKIIPRCNDVLHLWKNVIKKVC